MIIFDALLLGAYRPGLGILAPLAPVLMALGYCYWRGRGADYGAPGFMGKLGYAAVAALAAWCAGFWLPQAVLVGLFCFIANMNSHGAYYWMASKPASNTKRWLDWLVGTGTDYWTCFKAMAALGWLRGWIIGLPMCCYWMPLITAVAHPVAYTLPIKIWGRSRIFISELIFGAMLGFCFILAKFFGPF